MSKGLNRKTELDSCYADELPAKMDKPETVVKLDGDKPPPRRSTITRSRRSQHYKNKTSNRSRASAKDDDTNNSDSGLSSILGRLWCGLRRGRESVLGAGSLSKKSNGMLESGAAVVGPVKDPHTIIPADVMFSSKRVALYSNMVTLLVHNSYYLSRIVHNIKHHECDALLAIILDSVFCSQAYEPALTSLFSEIIELEVDRTSSIDTVMRNDAPSVHMLSAFLKKKSCLDYLQLAVGQTIETIVELGNVSLDPELASVYQDWARTQTPIRRLPLVVSAVEAASYTEVQNLSRRRQRYLAHIASHCLFDIISTRHRIPAGLLSICASTLNATKRKFPHVDQAKGYSLVGGIFFLRFINAALTSPNQYGLLKEEPVGMVKANLKLVARLIQRLSNYSAKPPEEWPLDSRKFIKSNVSQFHGFLASLTSKNIADGDFALLDDGTHHDEEDSQETSISPLRDNSNIGVEAYRLMSMPKATRHKPKEKSRVRLAREASAKILPSLLQNNAKEADHTENQSSRAEILSAKSSATATAEGTSVGCNGSALVNEQDQHLDNEDPLPPGNSALSVLLPKAAGFAIGATELKHGTPYSASAAVTSATAGDSVETKNKQDAEHSSTDNGSSNSSSNTSNTSNSEASTTDSYSMHSMYNLGDTHSGKGADSRRASGAGGDYSNSVTLPLNDLYLLQKYLTLYSDAWMPNESAKSIKLALADDHCETDATDDQTPMHNCLISLEAPPPLVSTENNHKTRIFLTSQKLP
ncbi:RasGAP protein [Coemansia sp. RSA 1646]|nr:RasGAP protein [Coemansia sp. RSA 1646]KAJ2091447.1 RasGAP protein [Coemansia sp. RSA 986]